MTRHDCLWAAWKKTEANAGAAGGDGVTVARFAADAANRVSRLSHDLRNGRYAPGPSRRVLVPKKSGGLRPLDIPPVVDRVAQGAVALTLSPVLEKTFEESSFGYRPGRSVADAIRRIVSLRRDGFRHVVDADITRYFEIVPHEPLLERLEAAAGDEAIVDLAGVWLDHHSLEGRGLPQGSPLSPLLANLYLDALDEAIEGRGVRIVRYAEDFVVLCKDEARAGAAMAETARLLAEHGLELHPEKTRLADFDRGFRFLGHVFVKGMVWQETPVADEPPDEEALAEAALAAAGQEEDAPWAPDPAAEAPQRGRYAPRQRLLYVLEPGRRLTADGDVFVVMDVADAQGACETAVRVAQMRVDRIELSVHATVDAAALDLAAASDTALVRVNGFGECVGRWEGRAPDRHRRQLAQAGVALDPGLRLAMARAIAGARVFNQRVQLKRMARTRSLGELAVVTRKLQRIVRAIELKPGLDIEAVMGLEGEAAALYWPTVARLMDAPTFSRACAVGGAAMIRSTPSSTCSRACFRATFPSPSTAPASMAASPCCMGPKTQPRRSPSI